jgi:cytochrome P450
MATASVCGLTCLPIRDSVFTHVITGGVTRYKWAQYLPLKPNYEMRSFKKAWAQWNDDAHAEALKGTNKRDVPIVQTYESVANGSISREAVLQTMDEMLFANLDVSIGALAWAFVFIAANSQVQERLFSEISSAHIDQATRTQYLMSQSNYLHHILLEAGRLRPVAAFSVAQACPTQRQLGPYILPAGSKFVVDAHALNIRDPLWDPDNESFRPERWAGDNVQRAKDVRYCYWRFGFGPRVCLGKYVVDLIMKALLVEVIKAWEVKLEHKDGTEWILEEGTWILPPDMRIACIKRKL